MSLARSPKQYTGVRPINPPNVIYADRSPASTDVAYVRGDLWEDLTGLTVWSYAGGGVWIALGTGASGGVVTINSLSPVAGNIIIAGTANQIGVANAGHTVTLSIPSTFIAPGTIASTTTITAGSALIATTTVTAGTGITSTTGNIVASAGNISATAGSITAGTTVTATLGAITATNGDVVLGTAGNKLKSTSVASTTSAGANSFGKVSLSSGAAVVSTSAALTGSIIFLTVQALGTVTVATPVAVTARSNGVSFTITSSDATDTSSIGWMIVN